MAWRSTYIIPPNVCSPPFFPNESCSGQHSCIHSHCCTVIHAVHRCSGAVAGWLHTRAARVQQGKGRAELQPARPAAACGPGKRAAKHVSTQALAEGLARWLVVCPWPARARGAPPTPPGPGPGCAARSLCGTGPACVPPCAGAVCMSCPTHRHHHRHEHLWCHIRPDLAGGCGRRLAGAAVLGVACHIASPHSKSDC